MHRNPHINVGVIGGGIGGLVASTHLAHAGYHVELFEQGDRVGGKCNVDMFDGGTFETGPTLVTMPFVLDEVFARVGRNREDYIRLHPVDPACQYRWSEGSRLDMPFAVDDVITAIDAFSSGEGEHARRYLQHAQEVYELTKDIFIFSPFDGLREFMKLKNLSMLPKLPRLRFASTLHKHNASYFSDPRLRQLFDRFATYNGSNPYKAPATLMVIPWVEIGFGAWYPEGGMYAIVDGLAKLATDLGVVIHTNSRVTSINVSNKQVRGLHLATGDVYACHHVVSNADVYVTQKHLLGMSVAKPSDLSCSGFVMQVSVEQEDFGLSHHNILFADDYKEEFAALERGAHHHAKSTIYISRSVAADSSLAAEGRENWFILINAPANGVSPLLNSSEQSAWQGHQERLAEQTFERLAAFGLQPSVRSYKVRTPDTMAAEWSSYRGALYGASSNSPLSAFLRPRQKSRDVENLWYVGGSAHPGGGIPLVATSGMIAADLIQRTPSF